MSTIQQLSAKLDHSTHQATQRTIEYLKLRGMDQNTVARRLGVVYEVISRWKNGKTPLSAKNALGILRLVQIVTASKPLSTKVETEALHTLIKLWIESVQLRTELAGKIQHELGTKLARLAKKPMLNERDQEEQKSLVTQAHRIAIALEQSLIFKYAWEACQDNLLEGIEQAMNNLGLERDMENNLISIV